MTTCSDNDGATVELGSVHFPVAGPVRYAVTAKDAVERPAKTCFRRGVRREERSEAVGDQTELPLVRVADSAQ